MSREAVRVQPGNAAEVLDLADRLRVYQNAGKVAAHQDLAVALGHQGIDKARPIGEDIGDVGLDQIAVGVQAGDAPDRRYKW